MPSTRNGGPQTTPSGGVVGQQETPTKEDKEGKVEEDESSASDEDSFSYDEGESERRKSRCLDDMLHLENQFADLKELLYKERMEDVEQKLDQLSKDSAPEYVNPLRELTENRDKRLHVSELVLAQKKYGSQCKYEQEIASATLDYEEGAKLCKMKIISEIEENIQRLKEEEVLADMTAESNHRKRKLKPSEFLLLEKRKKPVVVTGPYVVYLLRDMEIMEDINDIRRGRAIAEVAKNQRHQKS